MDLLEAGDTAKTDWLTINLELQRAGQGDPDLRDYISLYIIYTPAMTATAQALLDAGLPAEALTPPADAPLGGGETVVA